MRLAPLFVGLIVLVLGGVTFVRTRPPAVPPPPAVTLEPLPEVAFKARLVAQRAGEVQSREVTLAAPELPAARLEVTLAALRDWLSQPGQALWPDALAAPNVFWIAAEGGAPTQAALAFTLSGASTLSVADEARLLASIRQTTAEQGVTQPLILMNGRVPDTFLGQVALPQGLEAN